MKGSRTLRTLIASLVVCAGVVGGSSAADGCVLYCAQVYRHCVMNGGAMDECEYLREQCLETQCSAP